LTVSHDPMIELAAATGLTKPVAAGLNGIRADPTKRASPYN
jgi:hypothetical protein